MATTVPEQRADDVAAAQRVDELLTLQRRAFLADPMPSAAVRRERVEAVAEMAMRHRDAVVDAMTADFGVHPVPYSQLVEVLGVAGRAAHASAHLEEWMRDDEREVTPAVHGTGRAFVRYQPKGVVANLSPWNFPFDLTLGPLVDMLAAGNRVVLKPSEISGACSALMAEMVAETFPPDLVAVLLGGPDVARAVASARFDHIMFTGSTHVGRQVAVAAAQNLVPVTLELGGKCPAVLAEDAVEPGAVGAVVGGKLVKNGQMCISADHAWVPRGQVEHFVELVRGHVDSRVPAWTASEDCTGIITERHMERIERLLAQASGAGATLVTLGGEPDRGTRRLPLTLVVDPPAGLDLMSEEIFGPILPVLPYDELDDVVTAVNAGERPLAVYVFAGDPAVADGVLTRTTSGGACVNALGAHAGFAGMGFGGVGASGTGRHHGFDGFREFSNPRGWFVRGEGDILPAFDPPYSGPAADLATAAFAAWDAQRERR